MKKRKYAVLDCNGCILGTIHAVGSDEAKAEALERFGAAVYEVEVLS